MWPLLFTRRSNRTSCTKQKVWRTNNKYGSQSAKIKTVSQSFSLSLKLRDKAKESLKLCSYTPLHPFYFDKMNQMLRLKSLSQLSAWQSGKTVFSPFTAAEDCDLPEILSFYLHLEETWVFIHALKGNKWYFLLRQKKPTNQRPTQ